MTQLLVQINPGECPGPCSLCGRPYEPANGPLLVRAEGLQPVCRACAGRNSAALALAQLADEAVRVARIGRHNVFPPYNVLLDLARAAEVFALAVTRREAA